MALFVSNFTNKIDRKGRVSVPAPFRQILAAKGSDAVVLYPHPKHAAIEGGGMDWLDDYAARLNQLPEYDADRDALQALFSQVTQVAADSEGRIILPEGLVAHAGLGETAIFVGTGAKFEIWEPARHAEHLAQQQARIRERNLTVPPLARATGAAS
ncbi:MAG TPA: cell division/cell wall cluster transcriptional repressor MraZ [Stellaceae bacterium]|nr:cell division/cell wall cluster transcriptional repressor MraZ [Stellaceae bacterium]